MWHNSDANKVSCLPRVWWFRVTLSWWGGTNQPCLCGKTVFWLNPSALELLTSQNPVVLLVSFPLSFLTADRNPDGPHSFFCGSPQCLLFPHFSFFFFFAPLFYLLLFNVYYELKRGLKWNKTMFLLKKTINSSTLLVHMQLMELVYLNSPILKIY